MTPKKPDNADIGCEATHLRLTSVSRYLTPSTTRGWQIHLLMALVIYFCGRTKGRFCQSAIITTSSCQDD
jgi:hypothetical protein